MKGLVLVSATLQIVLAFQREPLTLSTCEINPCTASLVILELSLATFANGPSSAFFLLASEEPVEPGAEIEEPALKPNAAPREPWARELSACSILSARSLIWRAEYSRFCGSGRKLEPTFTERATAAQTHRQERGLRKRVDPVLVPKELQETSIQA